MQDRYAGDVGDYGKIALLRFLQKQGFIIGVNWYRTPVLDSEKNLDGSFKQKDGKYLISEKLWVCDPELADCLMKIARSKRRSIDLIQKANLIPEAIYYKAPLSVENREQWHRQGMENLTRTNLVFMDPDNGLEVKSVGKKSAKSVKYAFYNEVKDYIDAGKSVLVYNHRCRKPEKEYFDDIEKELEDVVRVYPGAVREMTFPKGTIRDYFAIPACKKHGEMMKEAFAEMSESIWGQLGVCRLYPEGANNIPIFYVKSDEHIFMEYESRRFNKDSSFEEYIRDIKRFLTLSTWQYTEESAEYIVEEEMCTVKSYYAWEKPVAEVAIEIGYGCG